MKHCIFLSVALCCLTAASYAQGSLPGFKEYARFARRGTGVELSVPGKFEVLQSDSACWSPRERKKAGVTPLYSYMLRSEDGDCVAFYPEMSRLITFYLAEVLTKPAYLRESGKLPVGTTLSAYGGAEAHAMMGADSVWVMERKLPEVVRGKYAHATEWYAEKEGGRRVLMLMCFFTEEGYARKQSCYKKFYRSVRYSRDWTYDQEVFDRESLRLYRKR